MCALQGNSINVVDVSALRLNITHISATNCADFTGIFI